MDPKTSERFEARARRELADGSFPGARLDALRLFLRARQSSACRIHNWLRCECSADSEPSEL